MRLCQLAAECGVHLGGTLLLHRELLRMAPPRADEDPDAPWSCSGDDSRAPRPPMLLAVDLSRKDAFRLVDSQ